MSSQLKIPSFQPVNPKQGHILEAIAKAEANPDVFDTWSNLGDTFLREGHPQNAGLAFAYARELAPLQPHQESALQKINRGFLLGVIIHGSDLSYIDHRLKENGEVLPIGLFEQLYRQRFRDNPIMAFTPPEEIGKCPIVTGGKVFMSGTERQKPDPTCESALEIIYSQAEGAVEECQKRFLEQRSMDNLELLRNALIAVGYEDKALAIESYAEKIAPELWSKYRIEENSLKHLQALIQNGVHGDLPRVEEIKGMLKVYFRQMRAMSDPPEELMWDINNIDFPCNEPLSTLSKIKASGGIYVGTGAGLHLFHMPLQTASHGFVIDYNRCVTELLIPAVGALLMASESPAQWLSYLTAVPLDEEMKGYLANRSGKKLVNDFFDLPSDQTYFDNIHLWLWTLLSPFFRDEDEQEMIERLFYVMKSVPKSPYFWHVAETYAGPIKSRKNFKAARRIWFENRITGISANWLGSVHQRISMVTTHMREGVVRVVYPSNIADHLIENYPDRLTSLKKFIENISSLPSDDNSMILLTVRGGAEEIICPLKDFLRFMGNDFDSEPAATVARYAIFSHDESSGKLDDKFPQRILAEAKREPLFRAFLETTGLSQNGYLRTEVLQGIMSKHNLSEEDKWRLKFALNSFRGISLKP